MQGKKIVLSSSLRIPAPYLLFESPRPFSPPHGPLTSYQPAKELFLSPLSLRICIVVYDSNHFVLGFVFWKQTFMV